MKNLIVTTSIFIALLSTPALAQKKAKAPTSKAPTKSAVAAEPAPTPATPEAPAEVKTEESNSPVAVEPTPEAPAQSATGWPRSLIGVYGSLGLPHVLTVGLEYLDQSKLWSVAASAGGISAKPKDEVNDKEEVSIASVALEARYFPTASSFYLAVAAGAQSVKAKKTVVYNLDTATPEAKVNSSYVTPKIGWFWQFNSGLNFGMELGAQIPMSTKVDLEDGTTNTIVLTNPDYIKAKEDAKDIADKVGKMVLPHAMLRLGYAF